MSESTKSIAEYLWTKGPDWKCPQCSWINMAIREICRNFDCQFDSALVSGDRYFPIAKEPPCEIVMLLALLGIVGCGETSGRILGHEKSKDY